MSSRSSEARKKIKHGDEASMAFGVYGESLLMDFARQTQNAAVSSPFSISKRFLATYQQIASK